MPWVTSRRARALVGLVCLALQSACAAEPARRPPPPVPTPPELVDWDSDEFRALVAQERAVGLKKVARSRRNVTRTFIVGSEMHYGLYLTPVGASDDMVAPDILDARVREQFLAQLRDLAPHLGQRLVCECTGVAWTYAGQKRFLVRSAKLTWAAGERR